MARRLGPARLPRLIGPPRPVSPPRPPRPLRVRLFRGLAATIITVIGCVALVATAGLAPLVIAGAGMPDAAAHGTGADAEWLGHAWVDGRRTQSDVDALAAALRTTGIRDLFVHTGPFRDDGTLDTALRPRAKWLVAALHTALPGVRVQAWLGAHPVPGQLDLSSAATRANIVAAAGEVLGDGFDGVHLDFEPVDDGNPDLVTVLRATHDLTRQRHAVLSVSASLIAPVPGLAEAAAVLPGQLGVWSAGYLRRVATEVDEVAVMAYDTWLWSPVAYTGYVRRLTSMALDAVPPDVSLLIGVPAYHESNLRHHAGTETMAAAIQGVRLGLGSRAPRPGFGVAIYVDFTVTPADWASYRDSWLDRR